MFRHTQTQDLGTFIESHQSGSWIIKLKSNQILFPCWKPIKVIFERFMRNFVLGIKKLPPFVINKLEKDPRKNLTHMRSLVFHFEASLFSGWELFLAPSSQFHLLRKNFLWRKLCILEVILTNTKTSAKLWWLQMLEINNMMVDKVKFLKNKN